MKPIFFALAVTLGSALVTADLASASAPAKSSESSPVVHIVNYAFNKATLTVKANTTVTFVNQDSDAHTVTSTTGAFDSKGMDTNDTWKYTFKKPGTFTYICALHPFMKGT